MGAPAASSVSVSHGTQIRRVFDFGFRGSVSTHELSGSFPSPRVNERYLVSQLGNSAPAHTISGPRPDSARSQSCTPAPNAFHPNTAVLRPRSARHSFGLKHRHRAGTVTPAPNAYLTREPYSHMKLPCTMKLKKQSTDQSKYPGPAAYTPRTSQTLTRAPTMPMAMAKRHSLAYGSESLQSSAPSSQSYNVKKDFCLKSARSSTIVDKPCRRDPTCVPGSNAYFGDVVPRRRKKSVHTRSQPILQQQQQQQQQQLTAKPLRSSHSFTIGQRRETKRREEHRAPLVNLQRQWGVIQCGRNQTPRHRARTPLAVSLENTQNKKINDKSSKLPSKPQSKRTTTKARKKLRPKSAMHRSGFTK